MRLFVGILPSDEAVEHLDAFLEPRREAATFRWASPDHWHLTLAFMGEVEPWRVDELVTELGEVASRRTPFPLALRGGGAFPDAARAKVLWCGVDDPTQSLPPLAVATRGIANDFGAAPEGGPFRAHLTLGRLGRAGEVSNWVRLLDAYDGPGWMVDHLVLVHSHLGEGPRGRPRHEPLAHLPLDTSA